MRKRAGWAGVGRVVSRAGRWQSCLVVVWRVEGVRDGVGEWAWRYVDMWVGDVVS